MRFKRDKWTVEWEIQQNAMMAAKFSLQNNLGTTGPMGQVSEAVSRAIAEAVVAGFKTMIEAQYTDEDFEEDIGLKP